ncbi:MAG: magnesium transporter CorA family protein [Thermoplasmata archaeon]|nr:magnesium transporter CorA family protein [Thermoplasmata archaeon]
MIKIYKGGNGALTQVGDISEGCWIRVIDPSPEEVASLQQTLSLPPNFIPDALDVHERSRYDTEASHTMIVLRVPVFEGKDSPVQYTTVPLGIILTDKHVLTVCSRDAAILQPIADGKVKNICVAERDKFLLQVAYQTSRQYLNFLEDINEKFNDIEGELQQSLKNEELIRLLNLEKSLVFFTASLKANEAVLEKIQKGDIIKLSPKEAALLDDALIETKQAIDMASIYSNILGGLMDAFASVISNNLNIVMKFLTAATIILMIPNLLASLYGMNVDLPFQENPFVFIFIITMSIWLSLLIVMYFLRRKLL